MTKTKRIVIAHLGTDDHWKEVARLASALRDAGMEVIYLGNQAPEGIVESAIQEDADVVGLSSFSGSHVDLASKVVKLLQKRKSGDIAVVLGGTVSPDHTVALKAAGILEVFDPEMPLAQIVTFITNIKHN
jgi:methylmalonyl-CoA mutase C-terminal domain/subunit